MQLDSIYRKKYEIFLAILFVLLLSSLVIIGFIASARFNDITTTLEEAASIRYPKAEVERIRALMGETELAVKAYTLTKDPEFMDDYFDNMLEILEKFERLHLDSAKYPDKVNSAIDSLDTLVIARINLLERIITSGDEFRVARAMDEVNLAVGSASREPETKPIEEDEGVRGQGRKRWSIFQKEDDPPVETGRASTDRGSLQKISADIEMIAVSQKQRESLIRKTILQLSQDGKRVSERIDEISSLMTDLDIEARQQRTIKVAALSDASRIAVNIGIVVTVVLVLIFTMLSLIQIRTARKFSRAARKASAEAMSLAKAKEGFVTNISHELRTPLNAIIGFSELIEETENGEEREVFQSKLKRSAGHLLELVNDLLDWSKIHSGMFRIKQEVFSMQQVLTEVREIIGFKHNASGPEFIVENSMSQDMFIGDPLRIKQVLINLVSNSFKFTETGSVSLVVSPDAVENGQIVVSMIVRDTGIGIPGDKLETVFEDFTQVDTTVASKMEGSGLGLPISRKLIESMGGQLSIRSKVDEGTEISIQLPLKITDDPLEISEDESIPNLAEIKVLIVDDNKFNLDILGSILEKTGCSINRASSADAALVKLRDTNFDLGVFDLKMPGKDGYMLIKEVSKKRKKSMKLIALTAANTDTIQQRALGAGYDVVLSKPINRNEFYVQLKSFFGTQNNQSSMKKTNGSSVVKSGSDSKQVINETTLNNVFNGDSDFRNQMLESFVKLFEEEQEDLKSAIESKNYEEIDDVIHKILPACRQVGATELVRGLEGMKNMVRTKTPTKDLLSSFPSLKEAFERVKLAISDILQH